MRDLVHPCSGKQSNAVVFTNLEVRLAGGPSGSYFSASRLAWRITLDGICQSLLDNRHPPTVRPRNNMPVRSTLKGLFSRGSRRKPDGGKGGGAVSSSSATSAVDLTTPSTTAAPSPGPARASPTTITPKPPAQVVPSVSQPLNPASSPAPASPPPTASDTRTGDDTDPWTSAYEIVQEREPDLMTDYKKHLASVHGGDAPDADLSTPRSVESIVKKFLDDREAKQWRVSLLDSDIKIREQAERLVKFLLWSDPIVKTAVTAQPYAALAWSGVSLLLPVGN